MNTEKSNDAGSNKEKQDIDKAPGEERGKSEMVKPDNLKGKNVDSDPSTEEGKPLPIDEV